MGNDREFAHRRRVSGTAPGVSAISGIGVIPGVSRHFGRGAVLYHQGNDVAEAIIVETGWIALQMDLEGGAHCIIDFALPGDILGPAPSFGAMLHHSAQCLTRVTAHIVRRDDILGFPENSRFIKYVYKCSVCREYRAHDHFANVVVRDARCRVAHLVFELFCRSLHGVPDRRGEEIACPLKLAQIGAAVGLSAVHVSRTLRLIREAGVVSFRDGRLTVSDPALLRRMAGDFLPVLADPLTELQPA
ncbi:MAG TPA: Crp/Fnr family transcriptional regulator [Acidiphilium sp.]